MTIGVQAWVTSAVEDKAAKKALVLAGSLRRVYTAKKLAVLATSTVSKELREKLKDAFDLVLLLEQETPNGLNLEDYAKVQAFSLMVFDKCVYLSPDTFVLRNCDEIFEKYETFAACKNGEEADPSVYLFTPSLDHNRALVKIAKSIHSKWDKTKDNFIKSFNIWMQNHMPKLSNLDECYNLKLNLNTARRKNLKVNMSIANFESLHPLEVSEDELLKKLETTGSLEKFAVKMCLEVISQINLGINIDLATFGNQYQSEPIAIVGMSFRLPGGNNVNEFWDLLNNGKVGVKPVPSFRWKKEHTASPCKDRSIKAGFLDFPLDEFDAKFFGISPKEAEFLDPQQRLLHEVAWEALEDAMIDPHTLRGTQTGIFVGSWIHDYKDIAVHCTDLDFFRVYMGNSIARLSHFFETTGPSIATESGCSSGIVALHMACKSLQKHETNLTMACGVNLLLHPFNYKLLPFVLATDGRCKTFDEKADGFSRAEACNVLLLKRLSDAVKDEDNIWGLIRGSAVIQEGLSKSLGTPTVHCESLAMEMALKDGGVCPKDVSYIEAHGTGTSVGDPLEVAAITKAYSTGRTEPVVIGSVKTNIGHTESASGITGIIKVLLSMKYEKIPKHLNLEILNPSINLDAIPAEIPTEAMPWPKRENKPRLAGVSSFGISGTDGHAIIQEPPTTFINKFDYGLNRPIHIMKISAKSSESMEALFTKYENICVEKLESGASDEEFSDFCYSANIGRATFNHRVVIIAKSFSEAVDIFHKKIFLQADVQGNGSQLCFLFTGQGSQYPNMAANLYETSPNFRYHFDKCKEVLANKYSIDIGRVLWGKPNDGIELSRTLYSQTSIFCVEYCLLKLWESWGVKPDYVMGHSLGEFAAAVAAGVLDFEDALMLVAERSRLIDNLPRGKMLVIRANQKTVDENIDNFKKINPEFWVDYAAVNTSDQTVVAGDSEHIEAFAEFCEEKSFKTIILAASHAFHSRNIDPMLEAYRVIASTVKPLKIEGDVPKYISGMEGKVIEAASVDADYWVRHTREKVSFIDACKTAQAEGCTLFVEVGPHPILSAFAMMNIENHTVTCLPSLRRGKDEWLTILETLGKLYLSEWKGEINWKGFDDHYKRSRVNLPFYPFNRKPVWIGVRQTPGKIHPLLGKILPNASDRSVFENGLSIKSVNYIQDHAIGNTVVFPGSGFLEMCLSGGFCTVQGLSEDLVFPRRPIVIQELRIQSPLALYESKVCFLQTVVKLDENDDDTLGYKVEVFRQDNSDSNGVGRWLPHVSAKFLPVSPKLEPHISKIIDIESIQSTWTKYDHKEFYEKLPEVGLRFGPKFQSLEVGWRSEEGILVEVKVPEDIAEYLIHPIIADAILQTIMLWTSKEKLKKKLYVPIQIGEFIWLSQSQSKNRYVYCCNTDNGSSYAILLDENGESLAYMGAVDFAETSVKLVENMIQQQSTAMPQLWEEIWKNAPGKLQTNLSYDFIHPIPELSAEQKRLWEIYDNFGEEENNFFESICQMTELYFLNALYDLGWKAEVGAKFTSKEVTNSLGIVETHIGYCHWYFKKLSQSGYFEMLPRNRFNSEFHLKKLPPTKEEITSIFKSTVSPYFVTKPIYRLIKEIGENFIPILTGKSSALSVIFPDDPLKPNAGEFYYHIGNLTSKTLELWIANMLPMIATSAKESKSKNVEKPTFRVLEIGAGTGSLSKILIKSLGEYMIDDFEYWYTDISGAFSTHADRIFEDIPEKLVFKKFNMEEEPMSQGLYPEYFDFVLAGEVIHVAKDLKKTLRSIRSLLKPNAIVQMTETVQQAPHLTFVFGLLEGYWKFQDYDLRVDHTTLTFPEWQKTLESTGFYNVNGMTVYHGVHCFISCHATAQSQTEIKSLKGFSSEKKHSWILFADNTKFTEIIQQHLDSLNRKVVVVSRPKSLNEETTNQLILNASVTASENQHELEGIVYLWGLSNEVSNRDQTLVSLPFVSVCQYLSTIEAKSPRIVVITQGLCSIDDSEIFNPVPAPLLGISKCMHNEFPHLNLFNLDLCPTQDPIEQIEEVLANLWLSKDVSIFAVRKGKRRCCRLASTKIANEHISIPRGCDRYQLVLPQTKLIADLEFGYLEPYEIGENDVEIQIKAMALNFRDVFAVLKPTSQFDNINSVGLDFAGVISKVGSKVANKKVGDRVLGMNKNENLSLPSHILTEETSVVQIPNSMTFAEGVTLPAVFSTALYCLVTIAKMERGETLLLHTASGGVGLCAIQLAKRFGVDVIATAGSKRKRNYLHNLGIRHVFNSRTTDFGKQILGVTNGKGVDIVLNSLTGDGFKEASLAALTKNGRFIEMSKLNVWKPEEVKALRPDIFYQIVDLTALNKQEYIELSSLLQQYLEEKWITPIAYETFDALNIREALYYLQKAKHIGKIVCLMPQLKIENSTITAHTLLFNEESTYLITGGLGGIGLEVAKYMLKNGAKHIAIASRSKPNPETEVMIKDWNKSGNHVQAFSVDIGDYEQTKKLFEDLKSSSLGFPTIRGVMHAAGVLRDNIIQKQTWDSFIYTFNPKVNGTWNLHDLTKDLNLEHFVVFSSMAALLGSPGQSNHSASNYFEDVLCLYRKSIGLASTSINWGVWGEVGVATEIDIPGVRPISTSQGILALEAVLKSQRSHISVLNVDSFALMGQLFSILKTFIADKRLLGESKVATFINSDEFWQKVDAAEGRDEKVEVFKTFIKITAKSILKFDDSEEIDDNADFHVLGIDSLMMLEMKNNLQNILGTRLILTVEQLKNCTTTEILANKLVDILEGGESEVNIPTNEELQILIREDCTLPQNVCIPKEGIAAKDVTAVQTVLLTGVTGALGPYLLQNLCNRPNITKIYCLIRKNGKMSPLDRLETHLQTLGMDQVDMSKVKCIEGDIASDNLGLPLKMYDELAEEVDAVIHSAVRADHIAKYWRSPDTKKSNIRAVNVKGTVRILEFAVFKTIKHVYYASTLLTVTTTNEYGHLSEDWQDKQFFDEVKVNNGYVLSKFISEQLIKQAIERGIPCKVFRFGVIGGESQTGQCVFYLNNHAVLRWLTYLKLRCIPDFVSPIYVLPVDHSSEISMEVFFNVKALPDVYHVTPSCGSLDQNIITIGQEMGIEIVPVSFSEFVAKMKEEDSPLAQFKALYEEEEKTFLDNLDGNTSVNYLQSYIQNSSIFFKSLKLSRLIHGLDNYDSTDSSMRRDVKYLKDSGVFEKFGIAVDK